MTAIALRRGQPAFRAALLVAYEGRRAITGCDCSDALEAAHIYPYKGDETNVPANGLLLRADLHVLFDLGLLSINPDCLTEVLAECLKASSYSELEGRQLHLPEDPAVCPSKHALQWHLQQSGL